MNRRPIPEETWDRVVTLLFAGGDDNTRQATELMNPYSHEPRVRDQLRRMADTNEGIASRSATAILRRQRAIDTEQAILCAACANVDPATPVGQRRENRGIFERKLSCTITGSTVWPSLDRCHRFVPASTDRITPKLHSKPTRKKGARISVREITKLSGTVVTVRHDSDGILRIIDPKVAEGVPVACERTDLESGQSCQVTVEYVGKGILVVRDNGPAPAAE